MSTLSDLQEIQELDKFNLIKTKIKEIVLSDENLWKMIYYQQSNPLDYDYPYDPYIIFNETNQDDQHGVLLFKEKNYVILDTECVNVMVYFASEKSKSNDYIYTIYTNFDIVLKGKTIQTLADESSRTYKIAQLIDEQFNHIKVDNVGQINREYFKKETMSDDNTYYHLSYKCTISSYKDEVSLYVHEQKDDEWGIARESYSLSTISPTILVGIQLPTTDLKTVQDYGYSYDIDLIMVCNKDTAVTESSIIKYNDNYFRVTKILEQSEYLECSLVTVYNAIIND